MASGFHLTAFDNVVAGGTGVYVDSWEGGYLKTPLPVDANDYIITVICPTGCTATVELWHSPNGVDWAQATDSNGDAISFECPGGECTCKVLTVSLLQYVKIKLGNAASPAACTVKIHYTTF